MKKPETLNQILIEETEKIIADMHKEIKIKRLQGKDTSILEKSLDEINIKLNQFKAEEEE